MNGREILLYVETPTFCAGAVFLANEDFSQQSEGGVEDRGFLDSSDLKRTANFTEISNWLAVG